MKNTAYAQTTSQVFESENDLYSSRFFFQDDVRATTDSVSVRVARVA